MKTIFTILLIAAAASGFSQTKNKCTQLPFATVDEIAVMKSDLKKEIVNTHPVSFADDKEHTGTYKVVIDCNGKVNSVMYKSGNFNEQERVWMDVQIKGTEWKAAVLDKKDVSSTIFLTVTSLNLIVDVMIE
jgi:hypothetical protein